MGAVSAVAHPSEPAARADNEPKRVAILMPAYNATASINRAVESLVNGTYPCDIYIVDDGSEVPVTQVLNDYPRVKVIRLPKNAGVVNARNVGLEEILKHPYDYVACLDADDASYPDRIATEVAFLDSHPEIGAVGAWVNHVDDESGRPLFIERNPESPKDIKSALNYNSAVAHSTAMFPAAVLRQVGGYSEHYPVAEDYELFRRITQRYPIANIPSVLVTRNVSPNSLSFKFRRKQLRDRLRIQLRYFNALEPSAWAGLLKTLLLLAVPVSVIMKLKEYVQPVA
jgi:glycosyltransferase involved in cell wall biosynthesis